MGQNTSSEKRKVSDDADDGDAGDDADDGDDSDDGLGYDSVERLSVIRHSRLKR